MQMLTHRKRGASGFASRTKKNRTH